MNNIAPQKPSRVNQDLYRSMTPIKRRITFSENMIRRRRPFLCSENNLNSTNPIISTKYYPTPFSKKLKYKGNDENLAKSPCNCQNYDHTTFSMISQTEHKDIQNHLPLISHDNDNNIKANGNETSTTECDSELETESCFKIKQDIKQLKEASKTPNQRCKRNETEIETKGNEHVSNTISCKLRNIEIQSNDKSLTEIKTSYSGELTDISGYYSNETSCTENSIKYIDDIITPLTNSTMICQRETSENETTEYRSDFYSLTETANNDNRCETYLFKNKNETNTIETEIDKPTKNNQHDNLKISKVCPKKYPLYKPHNFQIPLIIINEIEIINHGLETTETETKGLKTLKVPAIFKQKEFEENKELQKKLNERELFKQIASKDKVMVELLEKATSMDFPKLKHLCNMLCEKTEDGDCLKKKLEAENDAKHEEYSGFFQTIWNVITYPFVANPIKTDEMGCSKIKEKSGKEDKIVESFEVIKEIEQEDKKINPMEAEKDKQVNSTPGATSVSNESTNVLNKNKDENGQEKKGKKDQHEIPKESTNIDKVELIVKRKKSNESQSSETVKRHEMLVKDKKKDLQELHKELQKNSDKIIQSKEEDNKAIAAVASSAQEEHINTKTKNDKSSLKHSKREDDITKPEIKKKSKSKQGFLYFFKRTDKTKTKDKNKTEKPTAEASLDETNEIENMEKKLKELESFENKLKIEALPPIQRLIEASKKLENFMAEKNKVLSIDPKARCRRSGSFY